MNLELMSDTELRSLSKLISLEMEHRINQFKSGLMIGSTVEFTSKYGQPIRGKLIKINRKTANVLANNSQQWRVSISLLKEVSNG